MADFCRRSPAFMERAMDGHGALVYRLALSQTCSPQDAEDVAQDVFLRLLNDTTPFQDDEHLKAWLIRVTVNRCRELHRSVWKRRVDATDTTAPALANLAAPMQQLMESDVWEAVQRLPHQMRLVVHLHYFEGYPVADISRLTHCNPITVRTRLHRARTKLRLDLEQEAPHETTSYERISLADEQR
ncbi:MAG TPA: RNA polymerase sigma factor [Candidatus Gordonibacter avicola]|nr:RNA polymerase sigma factor [Candidatus Gordonibacter avicola]